MPAVSLIFPKYIIEVETAHRMVYSTLLRPAAILRSRLTDPDSGDYKYTAQAYELKDR